MLRKINNLVICATATSQDASLSHVNAYWCDDLYLRHPAFHYIICPDGKAVQMLGLDKITGGPERYNRHSVIIAYIGGIDDDGAVTDNRTPAQKTAILKLMRELRDRFPEAAIRSSHDFDASVEEDAAPTAPHAASPGFDAKAAYACIGIHPSE